MKMILRTALVSTLLCSALAVATPAIAKDALPGVGEVAPAFALRPFQAGLAASEGDEARSAVELDSVCGIRSPESTAAVLVMFVDDDGTQDLAVANAWHRRFHKEGLEIIAVSEVERPESFGAAVVRARYTFPVLDDRHHIVATRFGIDQAPFSLLLDRECRVVGMNNKSVASDQDNLGAAISLMLSQAKASRKTTRKAAKRR
jgi:hypothetical protein